MQNPYLIDESKLLYSKVFHDLAAPLGALTLCVDDIKKALPESADIIEASIETLSYKIRYWRLMLTGNNDSPSYAEAIDIIKGMAKLKNIRVVFGSVGECQGDYVRILLAITFTCMESLPRGGEIIINAEERIVNASGAKCYITQEFRDAISKIIDKPSSRHVLGLFIVQQSRCCGYTVNMEYDATRLMFSLCKD